MSDLDKLKDQLNRLILEDARKKKAEEDHAQLELLRQRIRKLGEEPVA